MHYYKEKHKNTKNTFFFVAGDFHFSWWVSEPPQKWSDDCTHQFNPTTVNVNFCLHHVHVINFPDPFSAKECRICNQ